jgi:hypothetical protein
MPTPKEIVDFFDPYNAMTGPMSEVLDHECLPPRERIEILAEKAGLRRRFWEGDHALLLRIGTAVRQALVALEDGAKPLQPPRPEA